MNSLFIPDEVKDLDSLLTLDKKMSFGPDSLIVSTDSKIYAFDDIYSNPIFLKDRGIELITGMVHYKGILYEWGDRGIRYGLADSFLFEYGYTVDALDFHNGVMYHAGDDCIIRENINSKDICVRDDAVMSLCSFDSFLYDGGADGVFETFSGKCVAKRDGWVRQLFIHDGKMYDCGDYRGVYETLTGNHYNCLGKIGDGLFEWGGNLLMSCDGFIVDVFDGAALADIGDFYNPVAVPKKVLEAFL